MQDVEFTLDDESEKSKKKELSPAELSKHLDRLIQDKADNQRIFDWVEVRNRIGAALAVLLSSPAVKQMCLCVCVCRPTWTSSRRPPTPSSEL